MAKILCVLYADPVEGYPKAYARDDLPTVDDSEARGAEIADAVTNFRGDRREGEVTE